MKRALALLLVARLVGAACDSSDDDGGDDVDLGDPGDCTVVDAAISPEKIDLVTDLARTFNDSDEAQRRRPCWFVEPAAQVLRAPAPPALYEGWDEDADGAAAGDLVAGGEHLGPGRQPPSAGVAARRRSCPRTSSASCSRRSSSPCPSRWPRPLGYPENPIGWADILELARSADRVGRLRPPRVGAVPARQDQPQLLDLGPVGADRPDLRRHRQDRGPHRRGPRRPGGDRLRHRRRVGGRPLRRHHAHLPQQPLPGGPAGHVAHLRVRRRRRGEVGARLQRRQPRRRARPRRGAAPAPHPARRHLPRGGDALQRQPVLRPRRRLGRRRRGRGRAAASPSSSGRPENQERVLEFGFRPANPDGRRRRPRSSPRTASTPSQPTTLLEVPAPEVHDRAARPLGGRSASGPGCCSCIDVSGSMGEPADPDDPGRARPGSTSPSRRRSTPSTCSPPDDEIGLRIFTTDIEQTGDADEHLPRPRRLRAGRPTTGEEVRRRIDDLDPAQRHAALRRHRRELPSRGRELRRDPHQRGGAAHRRRERRRRARRRPAAARRAAGRPAGGRRGPGEPAGAGLHHRLLVRRRPPACCAASPRRAPPPATSRPIPTSIDQVLTAVVVQLLEGGLLACSAMARRSFRDRFFTPPVARAMTSPLGHPRWPAPARPSASCSPGASRSPSGSAPRRGPARVAAADPPRPAGRPHRPVHARRAVEALGAGRPPGPEPVHRGGQRHRPRAAARADGGDRRAGRPSASTRRGGSARQGQSLVEARRRIDTAEAQRDLAEVQAQAQAQPTIH